MKGIAIITVLTATLILAGCQPKNKAVEVKKQDRIEVVKPKITLESLDARVSDLERSRAAARAAARKTVKVQ